MWFPLVTLDVEAMYNNMTDVLKVKSQSILEALDLCLKNNYFSFNKKIYKQVGGVGTGIKLAPPYACLRMEKFKEEAFKKENCMLDKIKLWKKFIDDIFI